ncbi:MAG: hypothetical protein ABIY63_02690 [Fibrobacteria bacterium]
MLVMDEESEHSHAVHILAKYRFSNSLIRLRRPLDLARYFSDADVPGISSKVAPELVVFSTSETSIDQFCSSVEFARSQIKETPLIVVAPSIDAEKTLAGFRLPLTYVIGRPLGFFKLLEAMQKLGMYWTVRRSPD